MPTTEFRPEIHGFPFANRFVNEVARLPTGRPDPDQRAMRRDVVRRARHLPHRAPGTRP